MPRTSIVHKRDKVERPWKVHPIWRGIGCILLVLIPLISWAVAELVLQTNLQELSLPPQLMKNATLPWVGEVQYFGAQALLSGIFAIVLFSLITIGYAILYSMIAPKRYGPQNAKPGDNHL